MKSIPEISQSREVARQTMNEKRKKKRRKRETKKDKYMKKIVGSYLLA